MLVEPARARSGSEQVEFVSLAREGASLVVIKRSRFIGSAYPAFSTSEALAHIEAIRSKHRDAAHHAYAYVISKETTEERASDDGEPRGTAGYPILEVIRKKNLRNVVCVVTRYFGGILLGASGLFRAYAQAATMALEDGGVATYRPYTLMEVTVDYSNAGKVGRELELCGCKIGERSFGDAVTYRVYVPQDRKTLVVERLRSVTSGNAAVNEMGHCYLKHP